MRAWQSWGEKVDLKIKIKHLLDYVKLSGMMESEHGADILFSPESGTKRKPFFCCFFLSAIFWGAMLVFSLLRKGSDVYVWPKKASLHQDPVGSTPAMTGGRAMGERQQKKSDSRWQLQHKHLRVRTPPWKESEGCLFSGAAKGGGEGCPLWDSQADKQKGEQTAHHTAELSWEDPASERSYPGRSTKIDQLSKSNLDKNDCH